MKKIIALVVTMLMICSSISTAFALSPAYVSNVEISGEAERVMYVGETITLEAVATPDGFNHACIAWTVDDESVVSLQTMDSTTMLEPPIGLAEITALKAGTVTITAYASLDPNVDEVWYDESDSVKITVIDPDAADRNECEEQYNIFYYTDTNPVNYYEIAEKIASVDALAQAFPDDQEVLSRYDEEFFSNKFLYRIGYYAGDTSYAIRIDSVENKENEVEIKMSVTFNPDGGDLAETCPNAFLEMDKAWSDKYFDIEGSPSSTANMVNIPYYKGIDLSYDGWDWDEPFPESRRTVIRSTAELTAFIEKVSYLPTYDEEYNTLIATYDDAFFDNKSLIFVNHKWGDGSSVYYGNLKVKNNDNKFIIDAYQRGLPSEHPAICMECDWLVIFEVSSFIFATQDVSLNINGVEILSCSPSDLKPPMTFEDIYNFSYYTDKTYLDEGIACKITAYEELANQFPNCEEILSKYNEAFFEDKFLYRVNYHAPNPAWDVRVTDVITTQDSISIEVTAEDISKEGYYYPDVIVPWDILFEFDNSYLAKTISSKVLRDNYYVEVIYDDAFGQSNAVFVKIMYYPNDKTIFVGDSELYYNSQKNAYFGLVDAKDIDMEKQSAVIAISSGTLTTFTYGNLDEDDVVDASDLQLMKLAIKGKKALQGKALIASDVDGDGVCDAADLQAMKLKIKNNKEFPVLK